MNKPKIIKEVQIPNSNVFKVFYDTGGYGYRSIDPGTPYMNMNKDDQQRAIPYDDLKESTFGYKPTPEEIDEMIRSMNQKYPSQGDNAIELIKKGK